MTWNLMSTHGIVLFYIAANPDSTMREMSLALDVTERRVAQIIRELVDGDLVNVTRDGRRNSYAVNHIAGFRHPTLSHIPLLWFERLFLDHSVRPDLPGPPTLSVPAAQSGETVDAVS
jgi:hypothetical protein